MTTLKSKRPNYVGPGWAAAPQGYKFLRHSPSIPSADVALQSSDEWVILLSVFNEARNGLFDSLDLLPAIIRNSSDFHVICASIRILGDAGTDLSVAALVEFFTHPDTDARLAAYTAATNSANLALIKDLIEAAGHLKRGMELDVLADSVSEALEREHAQLVEPKNPAEFQSNALHKVSEIEARVGKGKPVMFGDILDIKNIIAEIRRFILRSDADEYRESAEDRLLTFEAITGIWISEWFDEDENIEPAKVQQTLEEFEASDQAKKFVPGKRYFLGHPILPGSS